jgi:hypothetical protein
MDLIYYFRELRLRLTEKPARMHAVPGGCAHERFVQDFQIVLDPRPPALETLPALLIDEPCVAPTRR